MAQLKNVLLKTNIFQNRILNAEGDFFFLLFTIFPFEYSTYFIFIWCSYKKKKAFHSQYSGRIQMSITPRVKNRQLEMRIISKNVSSFNDLNTISFQIRIEISNWELINPNFNWKKNENCSEFIWFPSSNIAKSYFYCPKSNFIASSRPNFW